MTRFSVFYLSVLLVSACSGPHSLSEEPTYSDANADETATYSLVYIIHGDAGYLYHDVDGNPVRADLKALEQAGEVGKTNTDADVFIFHQRPASHFFYLFPRKESRFYYYAGGQLVSEEKYAARRGKAGLSGEAALYHQYHSGKLQETKRIFLYFGHEIPKEHGNGYHMSMPDQAFTLHELHKGMEQFNSFHDDTLRFDMTVLSTCSNGSPEVATLLSDQTELLIASPETLHLSYMDSRYLKHNHGNDTRELALGFAEYAYEILSETVQTSVSIFLYDNGPHHDDLDQPQSITRFYQKPRFGNRQAGEISTRPVIAKPVYEQSE